MKKKLYIILLLIVLLFVAGCQTNNDNKEQFIVTIEYNNGEGSNEIIYEKDTILVIDEEIEYQGYIFGGWYLDEEFTIPLTNDYKIKSDIIVYAKWDIIKRNVNFYNGEELYQTLLVDNKGLVENIVGPTKKGYTFSYWSTDLNGLTKFNFNKHITSDINLYAQFIPTLYTVTLNSGYENYKDKNELCISFYTDFYNFLKEYTDFNFEKYEIVDQETFISFCKDWNANGKDSFYGVGDALGKYYVTLDIGGTLENQPTSTFIGYCYQNNMYLDFIPHLIQFFAYWRTDEGYTGGSSDPNNLGNDFFASAWASLVDTCKFFHFTSENLNDTYPWFQSKRVKNALDNIPGVGSGISQITGDIENPVTLPTPVRAGYIFLGWYDEEDNKVSEVEEDITLYAKWEEKKN